MSTAISLLSSQRVPNHEYATESSWDLELTAPNSTRDLAPYDSNPSIGTEHWCKIKPHLGRGSERSQADAHSGIAAPVKPFPNHNNPNQPGWLFTLFLLPSLFLPFFSLFLLFVIGPAQSEFSEKNWEPAGLAVDWIDWL